MLLVMIDHVTLDVSDEPASRAFYRAALEPLGWSLVAEWPGGCGFGRSKGGPTFWLRAEGRVSGPIHLAFRAADRAAVRAFHARALESGGVNNGRPGLREYHEHYYGAFAFDPDGNNVEAVCHEPDAEPESEPESEPEEDEGAADE